MSEEVSSAIETPQAVEPKSTNWPKITLAAVLGFALLATSAYAGYWYRTQQVQRIEEPSSVLQPASTPTQTPSAEDETKDWKTYMDKEHGFEFRYPPTWKLREYILGSDKIGYVALDPGEPVSQQTFETLDVPLGLVTINFTRTRTSSELVNEKIVTKRSESFTDEGHPNTTYWNKHIIDYYINIKDGWRISLSYISDLEDKHLEDFHQILSTFKFLD